MLTILKRIRVIYSNNASFVKSVLYNWKYLPASQARYLPLIISKGVHIYGKGRINLDWDPSMPPRVYIGGRSLN